MCASIKNSFVVSGYDFLLLLEGFPNLYLTKQMAIMIALMVPMNEIVLVVTITINVKTVDVF